MNFTFQPFTGISQYFYFTGIPLLLFSWMDQWLELSLTSDKLRIQFFIIAIILIAIAAIINLTSFLFSMFSDSTTPDYQDNHPDDQ